MSFLFGGNKDIPQIKYESPAEVNTEEVVEEEKAKVRTGRSGYSTIATSRRGILTPANVSKKRLLGE